MAELDDKLLTRPIIVLGTPRSGTTFLLQLLANQPDLVHVDEPRLIWRYGNDRRSDQLAEADARPEVVRHIRKKFAERVRSGGGSRLLEKTPSNALRIGFVDRVFPDCRFVHVIRHPVDAVPAIRGFWQNHSTGVRNTSGSRIKRRLREASWRQLPHYGTEFIRRVIGRYTRMAGPNLWGPRIVGLKQMVRELSPLEVACIQWRTCVESACRAGRALSADRYFEFKLEEMTEHTVRDLLQFLQIDDDQIVEAFRQRHDSGRAGAGRTRANEEELRQIADYLEPTMQWLGYEHPFRPRRAHDGPGRHGSDAPIAPG